MSLGEILDDIAEDKKNIEVSTEHIEIKPAKESKFKINPEKFDKGIVNKVNELFGQLSFKQTVKTMKHVDHSLAVEVFTMLPNSTATDQAKLTSYPSTINKDIIENSLSGVTEEIPEEVMNTLREFKVEVKENLENISYVVEYIQTSAMSLTNLVDKFKDNKAIVISGGTSYDLINNQITDIAYTVDDTAVEYKKYENELTKMYSDLINSNLKDFIQLYTTEENIYPLKKTLSDIVNDIVNLNTFLLTDLDKLRQYTNDVEELLSGNAKVDNKSNDIVNDLPENISKMVHFKAIYDIIDDEKNFIEIVKKILEFLD